MRQARDPPVPGCCNAASTERFGPHRAARPCRFDVPRWPWSPRTHLRSEGFALARCVGDSARGSGVEGGGVRAPEAGERLPGSLRQRRGRWRAQHVELAVWRSVVAAGAKAGHDLAVERCAHDGERAPTSLGALGSGISMRTVPRGGGCGAAASVLRSRAAHRHASVGCKTLPSGREPAHARMRETPSIRQGIGPRSATMHVPAGACCETSGLVS